MKKLMSASALALTQALLAPPASAQDTGPGSTAGAAAQSDLETPTGTDEIVVTGIRRSLEAAADVKRESLQVVDSIVAEDIGKFPDPTTAAALQRVPGVQVTVGANNEITGVVVRGLGDILTTLNGREFFSTTGRTFSFQDLPAEALARVDVIKSSTSDLIEGGIAGITDLQLNRPFNFKRPTTVLSLRGNYALNVDKLNPQVSFLTTDRWDTGIGEFGLLVNMSWYHTDYNRPSAFVATKRSLATTPFNVPGVFAPNTPAGNNEYGWFERPQANASMQWQASPELQFYAEGLFAGYRSKNQSGNVETRPFSANVTASTIEIGDQCFASRVSADGLAPTRTQNASGAFALAPFTVQNLCLLESATFSNVPSITSIQSRLATTDNYLGAFGARYESDRATLDAEIAYQKSTFVQERVVMDIGKRLASVRLQTNNDGAFAVELPGSPWRDPAGFTVELFNQDFQRSSGDLLQARVDGAYDVGGVLKRLKTGLRYAERGAVFDQGVINRGNPRATPTLLTSVPGLPSGFLTEAPGLSAFNDEEPFLVPDPEFLRHGAGRNVLRSFYGLALNDPPYQPERRFDATEKTYASYLQGEYEARLGDTVKLDGAVGVRVTRTDRAIAGAGLVSGALVRRSAATEDTDVLPNASARLRLGDRVQLRFSYAKTVRRPDFASLNPGISYTLATTPSVLNSGTAGNPDLRPQKSDSFDATAEYYFRNGFLAVALYYRNLKDRVISSTNAEPIDGILYNITRPRNVGAAELKGVEVSGQTFFDFLPGALSGLGVFGNFTYADTVVKGRDPLAGLPLQGVSKYNFNAGLLFERSGLSARAVYTYRSRYYDMDLTGGRSVRATDVARVAVPAYVPTFLNYVRPAGRLDFSVGYDIDDSLRVDIGGTNVLRTRYKSYINEKYLVGFVRDDDTIYTAGVRMRF